MEVKNKKEFRYLIVTPTGEGAHARKRYVGLAN